MANNVYSTVTVVKGSFQAREAFKEVFDSIRDDYGERGLEFSHFLSDVEIIDNEYMEEEIGPQVAFISGTEDNDITITSTWTSPDKWFERLGEYLVRIDPTVEILMTYTDEFYNFAGVYVYSEEYLDGKEQTGVWFKQELESYGESVPSFPDFVHDIIQRWGIDLLNT